MASSVEIPAAQQEVNDLKELALTPADEAFVAEEQAKLDAQRAEALAKIGGAKALKEYAVDDRGVVSRIDETPSPDDSAYPGGRRS